jgi:hypothetical protein
LVKGGPTLLFYDLKLRVPGVALETYRYRYEEERMKSMCRRNRRPSYADLSAKRHVG